MSVPNSLSHQIRALIPLVSKVYVPALALIVVLIVLNLTMHIRVSFFTRDPIQIINAPFYYGFFSNIGILVWMLGASICFFSAYIANRLKADRQTGAFFLFSGLITLLLLFDDLFLFHDQVFPDYLNLPDLLLFAGYGLIVLAYLLAYRTRILNSNYLLLVMAFSGFAISLIIDIPDIPFYGQHLFEDGFKWLGIVSWTTYFVSLCAQYLRRELHVASQFAAEKPDALSHPQGS